MMNVRAMLQQLLAQTINNQKLIDQYIRQYPYPKYEAIDCTNKLRHKITDILNHIITVVTAPMNSYHVDGKTANYDELNGMCRVKKQLDQLRVVFLTVGTIKRMSSRLVISKFLNCLKEIEEKYRFMPRNRSFDQVRENHNYLQRHKATKAVEMDRFSRQKQRTKRLKSQLYDEMIRDLTKRQDMHRQKIVEIQKFEERKRRIVSDYQKARADIPTNKYYQHHHAMPRNHLVEAQMQLEREKNRREKRIFRYLEEKKYLRQQDKFIQTKNDDFKYCSPERDKFKTLPSTQPKSTPQTEEEHQTEEYQLPELEIDEGKLIDLKQKLDWELKLSKIKHVEQEPFSKDWQEFEKDSIDNENFNDLDDSLELMKQEEALNKTGAFKPIDIDNQEIEEYSFSHD